MDLAAGNVLAFLLGACALVSLYMISLSYRTNAFWPASLTTLSISTSSFLISLALSVFLHIYVGVFKILSLSDNFLLFLISEKFSNNYSWLTVIAALFSNFVSQFDVDCFRINAQCQQNKGFNLIFAYSWHFVNGSVLWNAIRLDRHRLLWRDEFSRSSALSGNSSSFLSISNIFFC